MALILGLNLLSGAIFLAGIWPNAFQGGSDFVAFYTGAKLVAGGEGRHLYSYDYQAQLQAEISGGRRAQPLPFNHPAHEGLLVAPLAFFSYRHALLLWLLVNASLGGLAVVLIARTGDTSERAGLLGIAVAVFGFPALVALGLGQDSLLLLAVVAAAGYCLERRRFVAAGVFLAIGLLKFQFIPVLVIGLLRRETRSMLLGFAPAAAVIVMIWLAITGPAGFTDYFHLIRLQMWHMPEQAAASSPVMMPNLRGLLSTNLAVLFSRKWLDALVAVLTTLLLLLPLTIRRVDWRDPQQRQYYWALLLTLSVLASYHAHVYDLVLLSPVVVVLIQSTVSRDRTRTLMRILGCVLLFGPFYILLMLTRTMNWLCVLLLVLAVCLWTTVKRAIRGLDRDGGVVA